METTIIHVNRNTIDSNRKQGVEQPPIRVQRPDGRVDYGSAVFTSGPCRVVYHPNDPLKCGAKVWIETESHVFVEGVDDHQ